MTEEAIYALQFLESLLETTMRSGQFRNNPRTSRMQRMHRKRRVSVGCPEDEDAERVE